MEETDVLIVGAGPVGLTAACELRRRDVDCLIIDSIEDPPQYAKAVGIQPRTLEMWEDMGMLDKALEAGLDFRGQIIYVNGEQVAQVELALPPEVPFGFMSLPQYESERLLREHLAGLGLQVERGVTLRSLSEDEDGVSAVLDGPDGASEVRTRYLVGCDGAHSVVRHQLRLSFEGEAFPDAWMLGDVEIDWSMPAGYAIRAIRKRDGQPDDVLVFIPLPGNNRYRVSMPALPEIVTTGTPEHGLATDSPGPTLEQLQGGIDTMSPAPASASALRWSSVFRISARIVDRYSSDRVFVAGDAAHIHPPTGAQGMNTGIQDSYNLAWKLALAVDGAAASDLLASYDAERRPIGEEVVGHTVHDARTQFQDEGPEDGTTVLMREAQLLLGYPDSPLSREDVEEEALTGGPTPGARAPDASDLDRDGDSVRLFELLSGRDLVLLLYADSAEGAEHFDAIAAEARARAGERISVYVVAGPDGPRSSGEGAATIGDPSGKFREAYGAGDSYLYVIRPDGYVGFRAAPPKPGQVDVYLSSTILAPGT